MDSIGLQNGTEQLSEILAEYQGEFWYYADNS